LVQPEDDVPYTLPTVQQQDLVFQGPKIHQSLDIKVHHDPVELKMIKVFQQIDSMSFGSHTFTLLIFEIPCSKSQPIASNQLATFIYAFTSKYIKVAFFYVIFRGWSPWKVEFVHPSHQTDHLVAWLQWSFEYDDLIITTLR
jgi:hypothetical protein